MGVPPKVGTPYSIYRYNIPAAADIMIVHPNLRSVKYLACDVRHIDIDGTLW